LTKNNRRRRTTVRGVLRLLALALGVVLAVDAAAVIATDILVRRRSARFLAALGEVTPASGSSQAVEPNGAAALLELERLVNETDDGALRDAILDVIAPATPDQMPTSEGLARMRGYLTEHPELLDLLREGLSGSSIVLDRRDVLAVGRVRGLFYLPAAAARVATDAGDNAAAYEAVELGLMLGASLNGTPHVLNLSWDLADDLAVGMLGEVMDRQPPSAERAERISRLIGAGGYTRMYNAVMRAAIVEDLVTYRRMSRPGFWLTWAATEDERLGNLMIGLVLTWTPARNVDSLAYMNWMDPQVGGIDEPWRRIVPAQAQGEPPVAGTLPFITFPQPHLLAASRDRNAALLHCASIAVALKRYKAERGAYPDELPAEMAAPDPFSDGSLLYRRAGDGFAVYSVSANGTDDRGSDVSALVYKTEDGGVVVRPIEPGTPPSVWLAEVIERCATLMPLDIAFRCAN